jgi:hypothetical protein
MFTDHRPSLDILSNQSETLEHPGGMFYINPNTPGGGAIAILNHAGSCELVFIPTRWYEKVIKAARGGSGFHTNSVVCGRE